jgi:hypothetical protein
MHDVRSGVKDLISLKAPPKSFKPEEISALVAQGSICY